MVPEIGKFIFENRKIKVIKMSSILQKGDKSNFYTYFYENAKKNFTCDIFINFRRFLEVIKHGDVSSFSRDNSNPFM